MSTRPIAVIGPTGTGKSALALELAEHLGGEIVNADAMQLYRGMDIGTAKLAPAERRGIPHHQLDVLDVTETATVARYQQAAAADVESIAERGAVPVIVGGSMLYLQSLLDDWAFPATDPDVRARWEARLGEVGVAALHAELSRRDPDAAATILSTDGRRIVRALEVIELTGAPFAASAPVIGAAPRWDTLIIGLDWDTALLDDRLRQRTDAMFDGGLVDEVRALVRATGPFAPLTYAVLSALLGAIFVPGPILAAGSGFLFGPVLGTFVTLAATVGTAVVASLAGRRAGRDSARALLGAQRADRIDDQIRRRGLWAVVGQRFVPGLSDALAAYAFGAFGVPLWQMAVGAFIGSVPRAFVYTALGASISNLSAPLAYTAIAVWCVTAVVGAFAAHRGYRKWRGGNRPPA